MLRMMISGVLIAMFFLTGLQGCSNNKKYLNIPSTVIVCKRDGKQCPDGSTVGRTGSNCEFTQCPK